MRTLNVEDIFRPLEDMVERLAVEKAALQAERDDLEGDYNITKRRTEQMELRLNSILIEAHRSTPLKERMKAIRHILEIAGLEGLTITWEQR